MTADRILFSFKRDGESVAIPDIEANRAFLIAAWESVHNPRADWKLVPVEPTKAMLDAACERMRLDPSSPPFHRRVLLKGWDEMLGAAPQPQPK